MPKSYTVRIQQLHLSRFLYLFFMLFFFCQHSMASQDAMVLVDRAIVYSDPEMTSPIGYVSRGKKLVVGEIARNKAQVYPIIVSGKVAYIRVLDVSTEKESMDSSRLTAERFKRNTNKVYSTKLVVSYFAFNSTIDVDKQITQSQEKNYFWHGLSLKGEVTSRSRFDFQILSNFLQSSEKEEVTFRMVEVGVGGAFRIINSKKFLLRLEGQALAVPFSTYAVGDDFRVKSYGYTAGSALSMSYFFNEHFALEAFGGLYYTQLLGFDAPVPYEDISPSFIGNRLGLGLNFTY